MSDYLAIRCYHDGITLVKLPPVDARGPQEKGALHRAHTEQAWRRLRAKSVQVAAPIPRNVLRFGTAAKS